MWHWRGGVGRRAVRLADGRGHDEQRCLVGGGLSQSPFVYVSVNPDLLSNLVESTGSIKNEKLHLLDTFAVIFLFAPFNLIIGLFLFHTWCRAFLSRVQWKTQNMNDYVILDCWGHVQQ